MVSLIQFLIKDVYGGLIAILFILFIYNFIEIKNIYARLDEKKQNRSEFADWKIAHNNLHAEHRNYFQIIIDLLHKKL